MNLRNKKILVTGSEGFIGSHLIEELVKRGLDLRAFVLYNSFNSRGWLDSFPDDVKNGLDIFLGDIRDPHGVRKAMEGCDVVMHLAALIGIPYSYHSPDTYVDTNIKGTLNILQAAKVLNVKKVIHTSTSEVYGTAAFVPITEDHPLQGQSPYSATKIGADHMALSFFRSFGLPVSIIRPFNTFGPRQSERAVIPAIIKQIASGIDQIELGNIYPTRDFTYVTDTARAFIDIAQSDESIGEVVNIGTNFEISIKETAFSIAKIMEKRITINETKERSRPGLSEVERLWCDNSKAKRLIGWQPGYAGKKGFEEGLRKTIEWFLGQKGSASASKMEYVV